MKKMKILQIGGKRKIKERKKGHASTYKEEKYSQASGKGGIWNHACPVGMQLGLQFIIQFIPPFTSLDTTTPSSAIPMKCIPFPI